MTKVLSFCGEARYKNDLHTTICVHSIKPIEMLVLGQSENMSLTILFSALKLFFQHNVRNMLNPVILYKCMHTLR